MSVSAYALLTVDELKTQFSLSGTGKDPVLEAIIDRVTDEIEGVYGRHVVSRGASSLTEYHTFQLPDGAPVFTCELRTLETPIISVATVHEDQAVPHTYGAAALLVEGTDYEVIKPAGIIRRLNGGLGLPWRWNTGHRAIKVVYTAGYATVAAVPARVKGVAIRYASIIWDEHKRGAWGVSGQSDGMGNFTRFASPCLTDEMKATLLAGAGQQVSFWRSGERDA